MGAYITSVWFILNLQTLSFANLKIIIGYFLYFYSLYTAKLCYTPTKAKMTTSFRKMRNKIAHLKLTIAVSLHRISTFFFHYEEFPYMYNYKYLNLLNKTTA